MNTKADVFAELQSKKEYSAEEPVVKVFETWKEDFLPKGPKVLLVDYGCSTGMYRKLFKGYQYIGLDQNKTAIELAKQRHPKEGKKFKLIEANKTEFEDNSVDIIFTKNVLQGNTSEEKEKILNEFVRVLKPGGFYVMGECTFTMDNCAHVFPNVEWTDDLTDGFSFSRKGWVNLLSSKGFELKVTEEPIFYLFRKTLS